MDRVHEIVGSRSVHQRGIRGKHIGIAILDTGDGVKKLHLFYLELFFQTYFVL